MLQNPFDETNQYENDLTDFKLPYQLQSTTDIDVMKRRYQELNKSTHKYIVRLGIASRINR